MEKKESNNWLIKAYFFLKKKLVWVPLTAIAAICTIISTFYLFTKHEYTEEIKSLIVEIGTVPLISEEIPDSIKANPTISEARLIQDKIIVSRSLMSSLCVEIPKNVSSQRYIGEFEKINKVLTLSNEINLLMMSFIAKRPELSQYFNLKAYQDNTAKQSEITKKLGKTFDKINSPCLSDSEKVSLIEDLFNEREMREYLYLKNTEQKEIFNFLNLVQKIAKNSN